MKMPRAMVVGQSCDAALTISINIIIINEVRLTSVMLEARIFSEASMDAVIIDGGYAQFTSYKPSKVYRHIVVVVVVYVITARCARTLIRYDALRGETVERTNDILRFVFICFF